MKYLRAIAIIFLTIALIFITSCEKKRLTFDENGVPHGTGWKEYHYKSGQLKLKEYYEYGQLEHSLWFKPDGTLIRKEDWVQGSGTGIYLREDGSIKTVIPYVNGIAHGMAVYYKEDGSIDRVAEFCNGRQKE